ncbi:thioredoxin trp26 family protein, partial [Moniliophthora roreri]
MSGIGSTNSTSGEENHLFGTIDRDNVHGLNLTVPEDAKELIKPWDQREDTNKYVESGVDDQ